MCRIVKRSSSNGGNSEFITLSQLSEYRPVAKNNYEPLTERHQESSRVRDTRNGGSIYTVR